MHCPKDLVAYQQVDYPVPFILHTPILREIVLFAQQRRALMQRAHEFNICNSGSPWGEVSDKLRYLQPQFIYVLERRKVDSRHNRSDAILYINELLAFQALQDLPNRRSANAKLCSQIGFA